MSDGKNIIQRGRLAVSSEMLYSETPGGTHISSSLPYVADLDQFKVTVQMESGEWRLRVNKGVVEFRTNQVSLAYPEVTSTINLKVISDFNIYPDGSKTTGPATQPSQGVEQDGYIKLDSGSNYWVFLYTITPAWSSDVLPCSAVDINNPQLVVCKETEDPNYIYYIWQNGGGVYFTQYIHTQTTLNVETPTGTQTVMLENMNVEAFFDQVDCCRHNLAHVIWDNDKGWQVKQVQIGPCIMQTIPQPGPPYNLYDIDGSGVTPFVFDPSTYSAAYQLSQLPIAGYTKNLTSTGLMAVQSTAPTGTQYLRAT